MLATRSVSRPIVVSSRKAVVARVVQTTVSSEQAIKEAQVISEKLDLKATQAAWDRVEFSLKEEQFQQTKRIKLMRKAAEDKAAALSAGKDAKGETKDPLEKFCETNADADECRTYE